MRSELKIHASTVKRAKPKELLSLVNGFNTIGFVQDMKSAGESNKNIHRFFLYLAEKCIEKDVSLPRSGYIDMIRLAADNGLLLKT